MFALWLADIICVAAVWALVVLTYRLFGGSYNPAIYLGFWPVALGFVAANAMLGLYSGSWMYPASPVPPMEEMRRLFISSAITHFAAISVIVLLFQTMAGYSRLVVAISGLITGFAAQSFRNRARIILFKLGIGQMKVVLAGSGATASRVAELLANDPYTGFRIVGYFDGVRKAEPLLAFPGVPCLGSLKDIVPESRKRGVKILIACQDERFLRCQLDEFTGWFTYIEYVPTASAFPVFGAKAVSFDGVGGIEMVNQARKRAFSIQKRLLDAALSFIAFIIASPLFILIPLAIKLTGKGNVFYRQERLGKNGRKIKVWKFRSMYPDADVRLEKLLAENPEAAREWNENFKLRNDPRITTVGRFLRKTSLDELPQLFNVFLGEMSLIGPRPIVEKEIAYYGEYYRTFSSVKPGITGLWQVSGRSDTDYTRRVALDCCYVLNWSPWMDVWITIRTIFAVFLARGAR